MSYNISKELFEKVMNVGLYDELYIDNYFDEYNGVEVEDWQIIKYNNTWIPLDTFVFKCKKWALKQCHILHSSIDEIGEGYLKVDHFTEELYGERVRTFKSSSEQQAVFDACQWILDIKESELTNNEDFVTKLSGALFQIANLRIKDK